MEGWLDRWLSGWVVGWMDRWVGEWMEEDIDGSVVELEGFLMCNILVDAQKLSRNNTSLSYDYNRYFH